MTTAAWLMAVASALCAVALVMTIVNLFIYRRSPLITAGTTTGTKAGNTTRDSNPSAPANNNSNNNNSTSSAPLVSVCVPARNEESNIEACARSVLASDEPDIELIVYDDQSTDATPRILQSLIDEELRSAGPNGTSRLRRAPTVPLPAGWNGKQHACWRMSQTARGQWLLFTDADVRFTPDAVRRSVAQARRLNAGLLSTFPRQELGTIGEALIVPMIFFILFSYLPMPRMRSSKDPATSAGCGQFLLVKRNVYDAFGGHAAFQDTMHDGIKMPRAVRRAGFRSDLFDGSDLCHVRMYRGLTQTWRGFAKNAFEGLGSAGLLVLITILHAVGHVLPWLVIELQAVRWSANDATVLSSWVGQFDRTAILFAACAVTMAISQRLILALRLRQGSLGILIALVHPLGVIAMTSVQWYSFYLHLTGKRAWRGRIAAGAPS